MLAAIAREKATTRFLARARAEASMYPKEKVRAARRLNAIGAKAGRGKDKGKGKGKGKISDMDDQRRSHVGASGADWNWAVGPEWGIAVEAVPGCTLAAAFWPSPVEAATPPWMAAAQPAWPPSVFSWPAAGGGAPAAAPGLRSMTPAGGVYSLSPPPVTTKNRFEALADRCIIDSGGAQISRDGIVKL